MKILFQFYFYRDENVGSADEKKAKCIFESVIKIIFIFFYRFLFSFKIFHITSENSHFINFIITKETTMNGN